MSEAAGLESMSLGTADSEVTGLYVPDAPSRTQPHVSSGAQSQIKLAALDIIAGASAWRLWGLLGWLDIRQRYRRSKIGPFWITISMGAMIVGMGFFYPTLFHTSAPKYLPFITLGFVAWNLISGIINDNCIAFISADSVIKQIKLPFALYLCRIIWRNLILFAHNFLIYVLVAIIFRIWPGWSLLLLIPGLVIVCLNGVSIGLLLGPVCARFRDVPQIVVSVLQIFFFLTPIFWKPEALTGDKALLLELNPFYDLMELIREPLLGQPPATALWLEMLTATFCGWVVAFLMYAWLRRRIAYWL